MPSNIYDFIGLVVDTHLPFRKNQVVMKCNWTLYSCSVCIFVFIMCNSGITR